jgi:hypothetical protein
MNKILFKIKEQIENKEDIKECFDIKAYLEKRFIFLTLEECSELWGNYSSAYCASWLIIGDGTLKNFYEWIIDSII